MSNRWSWALLLGGVLVLAALYFRRDLAGAAASEILRSSRTGKTEAGVLKDIESRLGRVPLAEGPAAQPVALPEGHPVPSGEKELQEYVAWLRSLGHDELLRLSNAEYGFEESELIERLQALRGPWVLSALGDLAVAEADPLLKAILVEGLLGGVDFERMDDARVLTYLDTLMTQLGRAADDPFQVAGNLAQFAFGACARGGHDYVLLMGQHLATSDNGKLLTLGYFLMGKREGGEAVMKEMLAAHASAEGRLGALEGLRTATLDGKIPPGELTALGLAALESETSPRNRMLLYEMLVSAGGEDGLGAVEEIVRGGPVSEIAQSAGFLALKLEPARALALFQDALARPDLDPAARQALYSALGAVSSDEGADYLLGLVHDDELAGPERLAGLRGLWNRPIDERLAGELRGVLDTAEDPALRTEALRMLVHGETEGAGVDLRSLAVLDDDASVRAEAVQLAAMRPAGDTREWLEERLLEDRSLDVKAAALGALVYQAHYTGDGDAVLGYLAQARRFTDDEEALAMIAEGERMVQDYDPRNLELGLAADAEFWSLAAKHTDGPAARAFERQARQLQQLVGALRTSAGVHDARRPAR